MALAGAGAAADQDDAWLLDAARRGDRAAIAALVQRYQQSIGSYLLHLTGDPEAAVCLTADTFVHVCRSYPAAQHGLAVRQWLIRTATQLARTHLRRRQWLNWLPGRRVAIRPISGATERELVRSALARLWVTDRAVLLLCDLEGLPETEVAGVLGWRVPRVRRRLVRARARFAIAVDQLAAADLPRAS